MRRRLSWILVGLFALLVCLAPVSVHAEAAPARTVLIRLTDLGFEPDHVELQAGVPVTLLFMRQIRSTCANAVVLPDFNVRRDLPVNKPVRVTITPTRTGTFTMTCGMNMIRGTVVVH